MNDEKEEKKVNLGERFEDNTSRRQREINGQVVSAILLSEFETVAAAGGAYDTLEIVEFKGSSVRMKLPPIMVEQLEADKQLDIRINRAGDILLLMPVAANGHGIRTYKAGALPSVCSPRLATKLRDKGVKLPARYIVSADETIRPDAATPDKLTGWVCRREAK